jgi:hypothetical protein
MYKLKINRYHKLALLIAGLSTGLFAAFTDFNPASQPAVTLAPFELKEYDLTKGDTKAYRPWFENGTWQGDIIEYDIISGVKSTDVTVGETDNSLLLAYANTAGYGTTTNWSARATFLANEDASSTYWKDRNIITYNTGQVDFVWGELSDAQKLALDSDTVADTSIDQSAAYSSDYLNFIRGDKSNEKSLGGPFRIRYSLLGDIINSKPFYLGQPRESYTHEGFLDFKLDNASRAGRVFVGANDGLLHVFDATDGAEVYAYLPSMLIVNPDATGNPSKLRNLAAAPYTHTYYVDGQLTVASAKIGITWKSVLVTGLGHGAKGLVALDVTDPDFPSADGSNKILFEKTGNDIGHIYGQPGIVQLSDGNWYIVTGNGFGSNNDRPKLLVISLDDGSVTAITAGVDSGGLSAAVLIDSATQGVADFAYAGDDNGDLWRFDLSGFTSGDPDSVVVSQLFQGVDTQPITSMPEIGREPACGYMVFFGTGSAHSLPQTLDDTRQQALYGLCEHLIDLDLDVDPTDITTVTDLDEKVLTLATNGIARYVSTTNAATPPAKGWYAPFPQETLAGACGTTYSERLLGRPSLRGGRLTFVTTNPGGLTLDENCITELKGNSWLMSFDYRTGTDNGLVALDLNGDGLLDQTGDLDKIDDSIPVGIKLGPGNISQPTIANLGGDIDVMYINGLILTIPEFLPPGPFLNGHIDVQTDSPAGGTKAANTVIDMSEGYDVHNSDGLGKAVDGHVHAYDTIHGVSYVDLFRLEPRRGLARLDAQLVLPDATGACPDDGYELVTTTHTDEETGEVTTNTGCLDIVDAELNRAYDTLTDPLDTSLDPELACTDCPKSEVNSLSGGLFSDTQEFMVVIANADLSPGASLQIGCKIWNGGLNELGVNEFIEYQDHIAARLEAGDAPSAIRDPKYNEPVVFTLAGIAAATGCPPTNPPTPPSLRLSFNQRSILDGGIHGTRAQCVLGLHDYRDKVCYTDKAVLEVAKQAVDQYNALINPLQEVTDTTCAGIPAPPHSIDPADPAQLGLLRDPAKNLHITKLPSKEGRGHRWRNGALTLQLLAVEGGSREFALQEADTLPVNKRGQRIGGTYASAFTLTGSNVELTVVPDDQNGLLYETTLYWHYSDLSDELRRGTPSSVPCYGDPNYGSALTQELGGLTLGEYNFLTDPLTDQQIADYAAALEQLENALLLGDEDLINQALLDLAVLLQDPDLALYDKYRDYAPGHVPPQHLLPIDDPSNGGDGSDDDAPAVPGITTDLDDLPGPSAGVDEIEQQRSWIDLTP